MGTAWGELEAGDEPDTLGGRPGHLISIYLVLGVAGASTFSAVAFIESIPRGKLTSNESSWRNHEPWHGGTQKKKNYINAE